MARQILPIMLRIEPDTFGECGGDYVWLGDSLVGYRPYDGQDSEEVADEVTKTLAEMLRERLGWKTSP